MLKHTRFKEFAYQGIFFALIFLMYAMDKHDRVIHLYDLAFFGFYVIMAISISYVLVPKFFYTNRLIVFWVLIILIMLFVFFMEEYVLEPVLVGGERGAHVSDIFYTLLHLAPFIFMMVCYKLAWDTVQKQRELKQLQTMMKESELRFLKSQINPHFLFNNLNNLYAYAIENSPKTPNIILELSSVLRYMLYDCKADYVPLGKEIEHLQNFTQLNELQIEERGIVTFRQTGISNEFQIAPLILSVFVENAFKHSTASQNEGINIDIRVQIDTPNQLRFICENSFMSNGNTDGLTRGIGLENVKKRLELMYPDRHQLQIEKTENIYSVNLEIDLDKIQK